LRPTCFCEAIFDAHGRAVYDFRAEARAGFYYLFGLRWFKAAHFPLNCLAAALLRKGNILLTALFS
jgi:hypothetical protein